MINQPRPNSYQGYFNPRKTSEKLARVVVVEASKKSHLGVKTTSKQNESNSRNQMSMSVATDSSHRQIVDLDPSNTDSAERLPR